VQDDTADRLIEALNQDGFVLYHQPILPVCAHARDGSYQEILIRFKEEEEKLLPPGTFIPILESSRLMHILDRWVLNRVIKWIHAKRRADPQWNAPCSSLNLSNDTLTHPEFASFVKQQLHKGKVSGRKFALEVTESDAERHPDAVAAITGTLRPEGCGVTLTSYTGEKIAVERLPDLGIDSVKLDIDIVTSIDASAASYALAETLQAKCKARGVRTIAEFVEKKSTFDRLKALGVGYAQGYGIAMPGPLA
jgi:EAL domain-containing protein (putative c-di-GMP-specific phosphodiesterase class I)